MFFYHLKMFRDCLWVGVRLCQNVQTEKSMLTTSFSDYLGQKHYELLGYVGKHEDVSRLCVDKLELLYQTIPGA